LPDSDSSPSIDRTTPSDDAPVFYVDGFRVHISPTTITMDMRRAEPWTIDDSDRVLVHIQFSPMNLQPFIQALTRVDETYSREMFRLAEDDGTAADSGSQLGEEAEHVNDNS